jgi:hypothetical protein
MLFLLFLSWFSLSRKENRTILQAFAKKTQLVFFEDFTRWVQAVSSTEYLRNFYYWAGKQIPLMPQFNNNLHFIHL